MSRSPSQRGSLRIGTRSSRLARWQAEWVAQTLYALTPGLEVSLVEIKTLGDRDRNSPLANIGGSGVFTKEIQRALSESQIDVAVHSLKDLPTKGPEDLILAAVPAREDPADALVSPAFQTIECLPPGAQVGTSSLRRQAQLLHLRNDLKIVNLRGNVETRLNHALDGRLDAVVLAVAGLARLGLKGHMTERLGPPMFLPAVGQGALGIECRRADASTRALLEPLNDPATHRATFAERSALAELEGGCIIPLGAWAREAADGLSLDAAVFSLDGRERISAAASGPVSEAVDLGRKVAQILRERGVERVLGALRKE
jgi:hydroxymethylbilane synthase